MIIYAADQRRPHCANSKHPRRRLLIRTAIVGIAPAIDGSRAARSRVAERRRETAIDDLGCSEPLLEPKHHDVGWRRHTCWGPEAKAAYAKGYTVSRSEVC
ncbi:MAG TPA: hypothetical protein VGC77_06940 [Rhodopseudomonas sp.]|uniref:hypothetical protein n=1 Tax=Rhodopseudomonas sp. TaxID=1078 RepID=UPI002ED9A662